MTDRAEAGEMGQRRRAAYEAKQFSQRACEKLVDLRRSAEVARG